MASMVVASAALAAVIAFAMPAAAQGSDAERLRALGIMGYGHKERAPAFSVLTPEGHRLSLTALRGKVVVLTFWTTWCPPCSEQMPVLEQLHRDLSGAGLVVVGVNAREDAAPIADYAREHALSFPLGLDPDGKVGAAYGVVAFPTTFVIARDGRSVARAVGPRPWRSDAVLSLIRALLAEED